MNTRVRDFLHLTLPFVTGQGPGGIADLFAMCGHLNFFFLFCLSWGGGSGLGDSFSFRGMVLNRAGDRIGSGVGGYRCWGNE